MANTTEQTKDERESNGNAAQNQQQDAGGRQDAGLDSPQNETGHPGSKTKKPGSQANGSDQHNNGRGGGK